MRSDSISGVLWAQQANSWFVDGVTVSFVLMLIGLLAVVLGAWLLGARQLNTARAAGGLASLVGLALIAFTAGQLAPGQLIAFAILLLLTGLYCVVGARGSGRIAGSLTVLTSIVLFAGQIGVPWSRQVAHLEGATFWILGAVLILAALGTAASRDAIYSAIWFALTLLCTGALMMLQGAQFLGIATVAVYAGAIVVTFLFVLMLAQPDGRSFYDRTSWGRFPLLLAAGSAALVTGLVVLAVIPGVPTLSGDAVVDAALVARVDGVVADLQAETAATNVAEMSAMEPKWIRRHVRWVPGRARPTLRVVLGEGAGSLSTDQRRAWTEKLATAVTGFPVPAEAGGGTWAIELSDNDVRRADHVAVLGRNLFGRHLVAVELAGVLLFIALVGAVAMSTIQPQPISGYAGRD